MLEPDDLHPRWLNLARRMQQAATKGNDAWLTLVSITVLCDKDGCPRFWVEPSAKRIEPSSARSEILRLLAESLED